MSVVLKFDHSSEPPGGLMGKDWGTLWDSDLHWALRICISSNFPDDVNAATGLWITL